MAIASSRLDKTLPPDTVFLGEVSLTGEVRPISRMGERVKEAARLGFSSLVLSRHTRTQAGGTDIKLIKVRDVREALHKLNMA